MDIASGLERRPTRKYQNRALCHFSSRMRQNGCKTLAPPIKNQFVQLSTSLWKMYLNVALGSKCIHQWWADCDLCTHCPINIVESTPVSKMPQDVTAKRLLFYFVTYFFSKGNLQKMSAEFHDKKPVIVEINQAINDWVRHSCLGPTRCIWT